MPPYRCRSRIQKLVYSCTSTAAFVGLRNCCRHSARARLTTKRGQTMSHTHAVGIDLGTTYSSIAWLNAQGEPVSIPNVEGELSTPSAVLFEPNGTVIVGAEAVRNAIASPERVVQYAKRYMGEGGKFWEIDGRRYTPVDVSALILKQLLADARAKLGPVERAVITVPAQFGDDQRRDTMRAGQQAGLQQIEIINEPVAAALCHVLGTEGLWFTELAEEQRLLVYDLGGGTFDLSLVAYRQNEVKVLASTGDLHLGGIDFNAALLDAIARQFTKEFGSDPRTDPASYQHLALEVEACKRSLTVRPKAALMVQHAGNRKTYQVEIGQFQRLTQGLVDRTISITEKLLQDNKLGWAHVDVVLSTGGSSRMPMVRDALKGVSGRTLNTSLSPDLSIVHGATYYAGMLLTNQDLARSILSNEASQRLASIRQQSVTARSLGIMIRDVARQERVPYYLINANTPVPASREHVFGTVKSDQRKVRLAIVESGPTPADPYQEIGECVIEDLPGGLPEDSEIAVTISYDTNARICLSACVKATGREVTTELVRTEGLVTSGSAAAPLSTVIPPHRHHEYSDDDSREEPVVLTPADDAVELYPSTPLGPDETPPLSTELPVSPQKPSVLPPIPGTAKPATKPPLKAPPVPTKDASSLPPLPPKKASVKPLPLSPALQKKAAEAAGGPPPLPEKAPSRPPKTSRPGEIALPALDDDIEELPMANAKVGGPASPARPASGKAVPQPPAATPGGKPKAPAATKGTPSPKQPSRKDDGEDEFWRLAEQAQ